MKTTKRLNRRAGLWLSLATAGFLSACVTGDQARYGGPPGTGGSGLVIRAVSDFYGPLGPYGRWETVGTYGLCWLPAGVGPDWQPYENGSWIATDDGWYWDTDEPWGWATYHYGRWCDDPSFGWCWVPATQWAPAWVSWCEGDSDYIGWAPLAPGGGTFWGRLFGGRAQQAPPERYVLVRRRAFLDSVRPAAVTRYHPAAAGRTTAVTNLKAIGSGPSFATIERASGRQVRQAPAREVRQSREAAAASWQGQSARPADLGHGAAGPEARAEGVRVGPSGATTKPGGSAAPPTPPAPRVTAPENETRTVNQQPHVRQSEEERRGYGNESHPAPGDAPRAVSPPPGAAQANESKSRSAAENDKAQAHDNRLDDRSGGHTREQGARDSGNDKQDKDHQNTGP